MQATVCREFTFDAAHKLEHHAGQCSQLHGHTYRLQVFARGSIHPVDGHSSSGMVIDFHDIVSVYKDKLEGFLDHQFLNDFANLEPEHCPCKTTVDYSLCTLKQTTAELLAVWILHVMNSWIPEVFKVRLYETPRCYAEVEL